MMPHAMAKLALIPVRGIGLNARGMQIQREMRPPKHERPVEFP